MKAWLSSGCLGIVVLAAGLAAPGCSGTKRDFGSHGGAAGVLATSGGESGKPGGDAGDDGRSGASNGGQSPAEAGTAGELDMAGAAGEPGTVFACGGLTCAAEATCTGADADAHCVCPTGYTDPHGDGTACNAPDAGCKWSCTNPGCAQVALDNDGDGHGSSVCAAAPGDDCDDTQNSIFPGAAEICDGIDNDCDKKIDMADGLSLVGGIQDVSSRNNGSIASNGLGTFGLIGTSPPTSSGLHWGTINSTGATFYGAIFTPEPNSSYSLTRMAWASGIGRYGVVYALDGFGGSGSRGGALAQSGCCWQDFNLPSETGGSKGDVTARGQGDLLYVATSPGNLTLAVRDASAFTLKGDLAVSGTWDTYQPRVAASGTSAGVLWQTVGPRVLNWSLISPTLVPGATEQLSTAASFVDISAIGAGYGLAWIEGLGFRFTIKKPNGSTQCSSSVISFGSVPANQQVAVADSAYGTVVVATSPDSNLIRLYRFDSSCKLMDEADVTTTANAPKHPRVALGNGQLLVFWVDAANGHYRLLSDLLCH